MRNVQVRNATILALAAFLLAAPTPGGSAQVKITQRVDVVPIPVFVADRRGRFVPNLKLEDFEILEDNEPQEITGFDDQRTSISTILLLDTSNSMTALMRDVQAAALRFVDLLRPGDVVKVIQFNERVNVLEDYTPDKARIRGAIARMQIGGGTALFNALDYVLADLRRPTPQDTTPSTRKRSIVVLSDGEDTASALTEADVARKARGSEVVFYAMRLRSEGEEEFRIRANPSVQVLDSLATETGGRLLLVRASDVGRAYEQIADELRSQYVLAYVSTNTARDGTFRLVTVRLKNRAGARLHYKGGYYAPRG